MNKFNFTEKITDIYLCLYIAKDRLFMLVDKAFYQKQISAASRDTWKECFENECLSCMQMKIKTYFDCAYLEFKARHLMNAAENLNFDRKEPWQGFTIPLENPYFPVFTNNTLICPTGHTQK